MSALRAVETKVDDLAESAQPARELALKEALSTRVFIVHGHDEEAKGKAQLCLIKLGMEPIVLHEQTNQGQTIIEKFEQHSDVGFAVVLLTPDDVGGEDESSLSFRARQNVVLELGYFAAKLGRDKVCVLRKGNVEVPSDFLGVVYIPMDDPGAWQFQLAKELKKAGHASIDLNKLS